MRKTIIKIPKNKTRITWAFNPVTRVIKNKKAYNRKKFKLDKDNF